MGCRYFNVNLAVRTVTTKLESVYTSYDYYWLLWCVSIVAMLSLTPQTFVWLRRCYYLFQEINRIRQNPSSGCRAETWGRGRPVTRIDMIFLVYVLFLIRCANDRIIGPLCLWSNVQHQTSAVILSGRYGASWILSKSEFSIYMVSYICTSYVRGSPAENKTATQWNLTGRRIIALRPVLSPRFIRPAPSSHRVFLPARNIWARVLKIELFQFFTFF